MQGEIGFRHKQFHADLMPIPNRSHRHPEPTPRYSRGRTPEWVTARCSSQLSRYSDPGRGLRNVATVTVRTNWSWCPPSHLVAKFTGQASGRVPRAFSELSIEKNSTLLPVLKVLAKLVFCYRAIRSSRGNYYASEQAYDRVDLHQMRRSQPCVGSRRDPGGVGRRTHLQEWKLKISTRRQSETELGTLISVEGPISEAGGSGRLQGPAY